MTSGHFKSGLDPSAQPAPRRYDVPNTAAVSSSAPPATSSAPRVPQTGTALTVSQTHTSAPAGQPRTPSEQSSSSGGQRQHRCPASSKPPLCLPPTALAATTLQSEKSENEGGQQLSTSINDLEDHASSSENDNGEQMPEWLVNAETVLWQTRPLDEQIDHPLTEDAKNEFPPEEQGDQLSTAEISNGQNASLPPPPTPSNRKREVRGAARSPQSAPPPPTLHDDLSDTNEEAIVCETELLSRVERRTSSRTPSPITTPSQSKQLQLTRKRQRQRQRSVARQLKMDGDSFDTNISAYVPRCELASAESIRIILDQIFCDTAIEDTAITAVQTKLVLILNKLVTSSEVRSTFEDAVTACLPGELATHWLAKLQRGEDRLTFDTAPVSLALEELLPEAPQELVHAITTVLEFITRVLLATTGDTQYVEMFQEASNTYVIKTDHLQKAIEYDDELWKLEISFGYDEIYADLPFSVDLTGNIDQIGAESQLLSPSQLDALLDPSSLSADMWEALAFGRHASRQAQTATPPSESDDSPPGSPASKSSAEPAATSECEPDDSPPGSPASGIVNVDDPERRYDSDGELYTLSEFIDCYGDTQKWEAATRECESDVDDPDDSLPDSPSSDSMIHDHDPRRPPSVADASPDVAELSESSDSPHGNSASVIVNVDDPERRYDSDGELYALSEFMDYYGDTQKWEAALQPREHHRSPLLSTPLSHWLEQPSAPSCKRARNRSAHARRAARKRRLAAVNEPRTYALAAMTFPSTPPNTSD